MALALALSLAGLNKEDFRGIIALLSPDPDLRSLPGDIARTASPSTRSESSGISSLVPSTGSSDERTPSLSPTSSRPETPTDENSKLPTKADSTLRVLHEKRDILNLAGNLSDPSWQIKSPSMPRNDAQSFMANRSIYYRLGENALMEDYPMRHCKDCGFAEPSPYLF